MSKVFIEISVKDVFINPTQMYNPNIAFDINKGVRGYLSIISNYFENIKETFILWNSCVIEEKIAPVKIRLTNVHTFRRWKPDNTKINARPLEFFQVILTNNSQSPIFYFTDGGATNFFDKIQQIRQEQVTTSPVNTLINNNPINNYITNQSIHNNNNIIHIQNSTPNLNVNQMELKSNHHFSYNNPLNNPYSTPSLNYRNFAQFGPNYIFSNQTSPILYSDSQSIQNHPHLRSQSPSNSAPKPMNGSGFFPVQKQIRGSPLSIDEWISSFDINGRVVNVQDIKRKIYNGSIDSAIRAEVWKYLLNYYQFENSLEDREIIRKMKDVEYRVYLNQWQSITSEQECHFSKFRTLKERIHKDVIRTDRSWQVYKDEKSPYLTSIYNILMCYAFFNMDIGYVQGMNDLVSIFLIVMDGNEADAFWCFKGLMDKIVTNFDKGQTGLHKQLLQMGEILRHVDPPFYQYLENENCLNLFFCFKWLLIFFKREFPLEDVQKIWDVIFSNYYSNDHQLFVCLAMLISVRPSIMDDKLQFDDILQLLNNLAMKMNYFEILIEADYLYRKFSTINPKLRDQILSECPDL